MRAGLTGTRWFGKRLFDILQIGADGFHRIANLSRDAELMPGVQSAAEIIARGSPRKGDAIVRRWLGDADRYGKV